jgi:adenylylsulfate kinase-like enzyme
MPDASMQSASAGEPLPVAHPVPVLWITGLAGVGKSTLAAALIARLQGVGHSVALIDGDRVRAALDHGVHADQHDLAARRRRAWRLARMAHAAAAQGTPAIVATISLFYDVQRWNRAHMPGYAEVLLEARRDALRQRRPDLYSPAGAAARQPVVGVELPAEYPVSPELRLNQDYSEVSLQAHVDAALELWQRLAARAAS